MASMDQLVGELEFVLVGGGEQGGAFVFATVLFIVLVVVIAATATAMVVPIVIRRARHGKKTAGWSVTTGSPVSIERVCVGFEQLTGTRRQ